VGEPEVKISRHVLRRVLHELAHGKTSPGVRGRCKWGYCYIETSLGRLKVDVYDLLILMARSHPWPLFKYVWKPTEITDEIVDAALLAVRRLPGYIREDLWGIALEQQFGSFFDDSATKPSWTEVAAILNDTTRRRINLRALRRILSRLGVRALRIDDVRTALTILFDGDGPIGEEAWDRLVERIQLVKPKGRPRKTDYDRLYEKRVSSSDNSSYGKLIRELAEFQSVPADVLRNRAKASVSYRKKTRSPR